MSDRIPILDAHQHLIFADRFTYSWTDDVNVLAGSSFDLARYHEDAGETSVDGTIFVEGAVDDEYFEQELAHVYGLASQPSSRIRGVVASCRPENPEGFSGYLDLIDNPLLVGLRRILHAAPNGLSRPKHFAENLRQLEGRGLTFDICVRPDQLWIARDLVDACPGVSFVLDHCGAPDIAGGGLEPWRGAIKELAERPNLSCKVSGLPTYCATASVHARALRPYVEYTTEVFGWDRVIYGGDWPVCLTHSNLSQWTALLDEIVNGASEDERRALYFKNGERIYGLAP